MLSRMSLTADRKKSRSTAHFGDGCEWAGMSKKQTAGHHLRCPVLKAAPGCGTNALSAGRACSRLLLLGMFCAAYTQGCWLKAVLGVGLPTAEGMASPRGRFEWPNQPAVGAQPQLGDS